MRQEMREEEPVNLNPTTAANDKLKFDEELASCRKREAKSDERRGISQLKKIRSENVTR